MAQGAHTALKTGLAVGLSACVLPCASGLSDTQLCVDIAVSPSVIDKPQADGVRIYPCADIFGDELGALGPRAGVITCDR